MKALVILLIACAIPGDSSAQQRFDIPAQPLTDALADFSRQAGVSVSLEISIPATVRTAGITGAFTAADALARLLAGTGLAARFVETRAVVVSATPAPGGGRNAIAHGLRAVIITGIGTRSKGYALLRTMSATRTDTPLLDVPQAITAITSELIADQAMQTLGDVVRYVPGVTMGLGEGHRDQPTIRGNNTTADFFVDGVRDDAQYYRDLYNVDRVEALKGPNAMIFGRGGGGGALNRVLKDAQWAPTRTATIEVGSFDQERATIDLGQGLGQTLAARVNAVAERSGGFRQAARVQRFGFNPTFAFAGGARPTVRLGYEYFRDERRVDRGIPSFEGRPSPAGVATFFGNPRLNEGWVNVHALSAAIEHTTLGGVSIRNRTRVADYDKYYQNTYPTGVNGAGTDVTLAAYNHAIRRRNALTQTDLTYRLVIGDVQHLLLGGVEIGRQRTDQLRNTGYFNDNTMSLTAPFAAPMVATPVTFRQSATDADSRAHALTASAYLQDQVALSSRWRLLLGARYERFAIRYQNQRNGQALERTDYLLSPRAGLVFKPRPAISAYANYSLSFLPSSGDQFTALSVTTRTLEPERFTNREIGLKWDLRESLAFTAAAYRVDRTNTAAPDPADPARSVQTGSQRTTGYEVGLSGSVGARWQIAGGYSNERATVTRATTAAPVGATAPLVPHHTFSLWNRYQLAPFFGAGLGVVRQAEMYAAIDNAVRLPGFVRFDGAVYVQLHRNLRAQLNVENLLDERYYASSHGNNNIIPGAPRTLRASITTGF